MISWEAWAKTLTMSNDEKVARLRSAAGRFRRGEFPTEPGDPLTDDETADVLDEIADFYERGGA